MPRTLAFSDRSTDYLVSVITSDTSGDSINNDIVIGSGDNIVLALEVNKDSWLKLFSAVMTGADLKFTDEAHDVVWTLWKAAKTMTFCEQTAACIGSSISVQTELEKYLADTGQNGGVGNADTPLPASILDSNWLDGVCDDDALWGACEEVIDGVFDATLELLQRLSLALNTTDLLASLLNSIPIVGGMLNLAYDLTTWCVDVALPSFQAVDSPVVRRELACDLFCRTKGTCSITMSDLFDIFSSAAVEPPPPSEELRPAIEWTINLLLSGNPDKAIAASISMLGLLVIKHGGRFGTIVLGVDSMQQLAAYGAISNPNPGWTVYCDCTDFWIEEFDFLQSPNRWAITAPGSSGSWVLGQGWVHADQSPSPPNVRRSIEWVRTDLNIVTNVTAVTVYYTMVKGDYYSGLLGARSVKITPDIVVDLVAQTEAGVVTWTVTSDPTTTDDGVWVFLLCSEDDTPNKGSVKITKIVLSGEGSNPFI